MRHREFEPFSLRNTLSEHAGKLAREFIESQRDPNEVLLNEIAQRLIPLDPKRTKCEICGRPRPCNKC